MKYRLFIIFSSLLNRTLFAFALSIRALASILKVRRPKMQHLPEEPTLKALWGKFSFLGSLEGRKMPIRTNFQDTLWCTLRELIVCGAKNAKEQVVKLFQKQKSLFAKGFSLFSRKMRYPWPPPPSYAGKQTNYKYNE